MRTNTIAFSTLALAAATVALPMVAEGKTLQKSYTSGFTNYV